MESTTTTVVSTADRLPLVPEEVTAEWLGSKLRQNIKSITMTRTIFSTGSKLFFSIEYADEVADPSSRPSHVCVKGVFDPAFTAAAPWTLSLAQREAEFFSKIAVHTDTAYTQAQQRSDCSVLVLLSKP